MSQRAGGGSVLVALMWMAGLCLIVGLAGCGEKPGENGHGGGRVQVFVNIPPQAYLAERIGGENVDVHTLVGPGQEPHTFSPTPKQMMALGRASIYFRGGMPFEQRLIEKLDGSTGDLRMVDLNEGITLRRLGGHHEHADHNAEHEEHTHSEAMKRHLDPHVWLSPPALKIQSRNIAQALKEVDPDNATAYETHLNELVQDIDRLHSRLQKSLAAYKGRTFYVFHPAFGYFARAYGLDQRAVQVEGKSPTPRQLQELIQMARDENVRIIFVQPQFESRSAEAVAEAIDGAVVPLDPLARDVLSNLEKIARQVEDALKNPRQTR